MACFIPFALSARHPRWLPFWGTLVCFAQFQTVQPESCVSLAASVDRTSQEAPVIVFNRIPKCGSTTMINLLRKHAKRTGAYTAYNDPNMFMEQPFRPNTSWSSGWDTVKSMVHEANAKESPLVYINHIHWTNFSQAGLPKLTGYIQMVREPVSRVVSGFYYLMLGPRKEEKMIKSQHHAMKLLELDHPPTINEYVAIKKSKLANPLSCQEGTLHNPNKGNMMTRYFCGHDAVCDNICNPAALARATEVMETQYDWVGVLEDFEESLTLLERTGPAWFRGILDTYQKMKAKSQKFRETDKTEHGANSSNLLRFEPPTDETVMFLKAWNSQDVKLYAVAKSLFQKQIAAC